MACSAPFRAPRSRSPRARYDRPGAASVFAESAFRVPSGRTACAQTARMRGKMYSHPESLPLSPIRKDGAIPNRTPAGPAAPAWSDIERLLWPQRLWRCSVGHAEAGLGHCGPLLHSPCPASPATPQTVHAVGSNCPVHFPVPEKGAPEESHRMSQSVAVSCPRGCLLLTQVLFRHKYPNQDSAPTQTFSEVLFYPPG